MKNIKRTYVCIYIYVSMYNCACTVEINTTLQINYISIFLKTEKAYRIKDKNKYGEIVIGKFTWRVFIVLLFQLFYRLKIFESVGNVFKKNLRKWIDNSRSFG